MILAKLYYGIVSDYPIIYSNDNKDQVSIKEFRNNIISEATNLGNNNYSIPLSASFEKVLIQNGIDTKNVDYTLTGAYYLSDVESSIRSVWPLNSSFKGSIDNPKLILNYKERNFFPLRSKTIPRQYFNSRIL